MQKTAHECGECKWFNDRESYCELHALFCHKGDNECKDFKEHKKGVIEWQTVKSTTSVE